VLALERVVYDVLCRPEEGVYGAFEECGVVTVYVECDRDSTPHFHMSYIGWVTDTRWGVGLPL